MTPAAFDDLKLALKFWFIGRTLSSSYDKGTLASGVFSPMGGPTTESDGALGDKPVTSNVFTTFPSIPVRLWDITWEPEGEKEGQ